MNLLELPCWRLDGTLQLQCENRRHGFVVPKPSLAQYGEGDKQTRRGVKRGKRFLFCIPAMTFKEGGMTVADLVHEQQKCNRFCKRP